MRIFAAGISTESNTFAPWPTGQRGFDEGGYWRGTASLSGDCEQNLVARLFRRMAGDAGHVLIEGLFAVAQPSGPTIQSVYERMLNDILADLREQDPFDVVLLICTAPWSRPTAMIARRTWLPTFVPLSALRR